METIYQVKTLKDSINRNDIVIKNLLKEISECDCDMQALNQLNVHVSKRMQQTRQDLATLKRLLRTIEDADMRLELQTQHESMESQFEINLLVLQRAVLASKRKITEHTRSKLFEQTPQLRNRFANAFNDKDKPNKETLACQTANLTESLQSVNRMLSTEVERSGKTLETLVSSSALVTETSEEFKTMSSYISNSKTLLNKYGRRELTDKILIFFALAFFFGCVIYVVVRRLYWK